MQETHVAETPESPPDDVDRALLALGSYKYAFPWQRLVANDIIECALSPGGGENGERPKSRIVILPTGAGKTLCFQLPAAVLPGITIVVYPLLALMADQERRLAELGLPAVLLRGAQTAEERATARSALESGAARMVLANPEVLLTRSAQELFEGIQVDHLVFDEAHCVSEWGDSFRPAYLETGAIAARLGPRTVSAFTATASPTVLSRVREILFPGDFPLLMAGNPDRPNISYSVRRAFSRDAEVRRLMASCERPMIVFCASRKAAEMGAMEASFSEGREAVRFYHAGLSKEERSAVEAWFKDSNIGILFATCAYGMGVDKPNVRTVVHRDPPPSVEAYLQESGRAGRDGKPSRAILVSALSDVARAEAGKRGGERYRALVRWSLDASTCRRKGLLSMLGAECEWCPGCDVCDGTYDAEDPAEKAFFDALRAHPRRYAKEEFALMLSGEGGFERAEADLPVLARGLDLSADEAERAIEEMERAGLLGPSRLPGSRGGLVRKNRTGRKDRGAQSSIASPSSPPSPSASALGA